MNVVLFGAGASYGQAEGDGNPPLTGNLYNALKEKFPNSWGKLPIELEKLLANPKKFEDGTTKLIRDAWGDSRDVNIDFQNESEPMKRWRSLQWNLAEFFFQFPPKPNNLYDRFFEKFPPVRLQSLRIATLNYDRLLLLAARSLQIDVCYSGQPNLAEPLALCLPHGASYLAPRAKSRSTAKGLTLSSSFQIQCGPSLAIDSPLLELRDMSEFQSRRDDFFPPVMSYIDPDKWPGSGPAFLLHQREIWRSWLEQATHAAVVGVRVRDANAPDKHLWEPLRTTKAKILYVSPDQTTAFQSWATGCGRNGDEAISGTWESAFDKVVEFLRQ